jgi:diguanylate cyclase (GGDEF)-like protein
LHEYIRDGRRSPIIDNNGDAALRQRALNVVAGMDLLSTRFSRAAVIAFATATLVVIGLLDYVTGYEISFAVFYLVPAGVAAWLAGRRPGILFAVAASLCWYLAERGGGYPYSHPAIPVWNAAVRLAFFVIVAFLLAVLRERMLAERQLAKTDSLTGALNARAFAEQLGHDLAVAGRVGSPLTLAYIDLDNFKQINDTFGHGEGDEVLRAVAHTLAAGTRRSDSVVRLGGDEFALILPGTDLEGADALLSGLCGALRDLAPTGRAVTWSIGAVVFEEPPADADAAVEAADRLMYQAKTRKDAFVVGTFRGGAVEMSGPRHGAPREGSELQAGSQQSYK